MGTGADVGGSVGRHHLRRSWAGVVDRASVCVLVPAAAIGTMALGWGVANLREAHLGRQRTGEGIAFLTVAGAYLVANLFLGLATLAARRRSGVATVATLRHAYAAIAMAIVGALVVADLVGIWVAVQGDRCIGRCG